MNILTDPWIPCRRVDGSTGLCDVRQALADDVEAIAFHRLDLNNAVIVFLIAILQTLVVKERAWIPSREQWSQLWHLGVQTAPLQSIAQAFERDSFMQRAVVGERLAAGRLRPESPSDNAVAQNKDIAVWRSAVPDVLSEGEAIACLLQCQMLSLAWGGGFTEGVVPGSSVFTLIQPAAPQPVWRTVLLNVLPLQRWEAQRGQVEWNESRVFPWREGVPAGEVAPSGSHPLLCFWGTPKAMKLDFQGNTLTGWSRMKHKRSLIGFVHPFVPYRTDSEGTLRPKKIRDTHFGFDYWAGIALGGNPMVLHDLLSSDFEEEIRLQLFGWLSQQADVKAYVSSEMPVYKVSRAQQDAIEKLVSMTDQHAKRLYASASRLERDPKVPSLYLQVESTFYAMIKEIGIGVDVEARWASTLKRHARALFDEFVDSRRFDICDVAQALRIL